VAAWRAALSSRAAARSSDPADQRLPPRARRDYRGSGDLSHLETRAAASTCPAAKSSTCRTSAKRVSRRAAVTFTLPLPSSSSSQLQYGPSRCVRDAMRSASRAWRMPLINAILHSTTGQPLRHGPVAAPLMSRKRRAIRTQGACLKTHADRPPAQRGAPCLTLLGQYSARSWDGAAMAAFGESCRDSGHVFSSLFDPLRTSPCWLNAG
jgi:hypothetical protein